jgi:Arc/MetJ-type ribon-helix-helix transcriptional regulator
MQVSIRLSRPEYQYIQHLIDKGVFASYGHSLRALLHYYKVNQRTIEQFRAENARLKERLQLVVEGKLDAKKAVS